jgi:hypothetical protein
MRIQVAAAVALALLMMIVVNPLVATEQNDMQGMPGMDMQHSETDESLKAIAKHASDRRESEFNHHLAGFLLILAGAFLLAQKKLGKHWHWVQYVWPSCFLAAGVYLLIFSDTEIWPFGRQSFWFAIRNDPEDLQHKIFALILIGIGIVEFQRARGRLRSTWSAWVFPVAGMIGAVILLFHQHRAGMHGADHMVLMQHIQKEHRAFAVAGGGIALAKALSEVQSSWQGIFTRMWPLLLIVLGVLLMSYTE